MKTISEYKALENKTSNSDDTYFVVRDTNHPAEDLVRDWSAPQGGFWCGDMCCNVYSTIEEAQADWEEKSSADVPEFRFHPAYNSYVEVHYEGLGAWSLEADTIEEAIEEVGKEYTEMDDLANTEDTGDGHFYAEDCVSFRKVAESRYIFEIKSEF